MSRLPIERPGARRTRRAAFSLVEVVVTTLLLSLLLFSGIALMSAGTRFFDGTIQAATTENSVDIAARRIETELRQARSFVIAADGQSITYYKFTDTTPPASDPTPYRFYRAGTDLGTESASGANLVWSAQPARALLSHVPVADGSDTLLLFSPSGNAAQVGNRVSVSLISRRPIRNGGGVRYTEQRTLLYVNARNIAGP